MDFTIRNIPKPLFEALSQMAKASGRSIEEEVKFILESEFNPNLRSRDGLSSISAQKKI